jgi:hypothetical protein
VASDKFGRFRIREEASQGGFIRHDRIDTDDALRSAGIHLECLVEESVSKTNDPGAVQAALTVAGFRLRDSTQE